MKCKIEMILQNVIQEAKKILGKEVYIFENHNMALPIWGKFADFLRSPVNLITFDTHTDTQPALSLYATNNMISERTVQNILQNPKLHFGKEFSREHLFSFSKNKVGNADHIETAMALGHLSSYIVVHRENEFTIDSNDCEDLNTENRKFFHRENIDWSVLYNIESPFVLDFDMDYFHNISDMDNVFKKQIAPLIRRAEVITIALESYFFEFHKEDDSIFTSDLALHELKEIIKYALE